MKLHTKIFLGMLTGIVLGLIIRQLHLPAETVQTIVAWVEPIGKLFMNFVFMMVIPLILSALILGVTEIGDLRKLGKMGGHLLKYTVIVSFIAVMIGVLLVDVFEPGKKISPETRQYLLEEYSSEAFKAQNYSEQNKKKTIGDVLVNLVPKNPIYEMSHAFDSQNTGGGLVSVMIFALIFGIAMTAVDSEKSAPFRQFLESLYEIVLKIISYAMSLAPYGVASLLFVMVINVGADFLISLIWFFGVVMLGLTLHQFVTYTIVLKYFAGRKPLQFMKDMSEVSLTAFSTSSSNATLPTAIRVSIDKLKIPKPITHFVLTVGSTANQNGTALFEGITVLFLAQCFDVELSFGSQIMVVMLCVLAGVGTAGVPGGSLPVIVTILVSIGVPGESIALIYGVDRILDMSRTVINVNGDITAAAYIQHKEEKLLSKESQS